MELIIDNPDGMDLHGFCEWLREFMFEYIADNLDEGKLIVFDDYVNTKMNLVWQGPKRHISVKDLMLSVPANLICLHQLNYSKFMIDSNIIIPNTAAKFINIINLINYGNMDLPSYNFIDEMFNKIAENLNAFYDIYLQGRE